MCSNVYLTIIAVLERDLTVLHETVHEGLNFGHRIVHGRNRTKHCGMAVDFSKENLLVYNRDNALKTL